MRVCDIEHFSRELSEFFLVEFRLRVMSFSKVNEEITVFDKEYELIGLDRHLGVHVASVVSNNTADSLLIICKIIALDMSR